MAEANSAPASGTSSTPPAAPAAAAAPSASPTPAPAAPAATEPSKPATPPTGSEPAKADATPPATPAEPAKPTELEPPLFTLPEDFKPPDTALAKFNTAIKSATVDGKLQLTPQQVVDMYVEQARDANAAWQRQVEQTDQDNKAACQARFTPTQLKASESAVGWFASFEPAFHDFAKRQLNDPVFVNAMRLIGESLQEDDFIPAAPPAPAKRTAAQRMGYEKPS